MTPKIFISSPYTIGDVGDNVKKQMDCADGLMSLGYVPFVPLLYHFQHIVHPRQYADWLNIDMEWLRMCDAILRLPGESAGADEEVKLAKELGKPVFYSIVDLRNHFETT